MNKYEYDAYNRMTEVRAGQGEVQVNRYDAEGLRHEMEENGRLVQFLYKGKEVVAEEGEKAGVVRYIRGLGLVSSDSEEARTYYHYASDELGSITHVVKAAVHKKLEEDGQAGEGKKDESKGKDKDCQVLNRYAYDAFGNRVECEEQVENRFGFAGELYDPVSALIYLRARFYNPVIGRFLQEDNVYEDGLNLYVYCRNNPVRYVDPSGHGTESPADKDGGDGTSNKSNENTKGKTLSIEEAEEYAFNAIKGKKNADSVVLGKYEKGSPNSYDAVAKDMGAQYFNLDNWDELSAQYSSEEIWKINERFLDIQTSSGREIYLSHNPADFIGDGSYYSFEIQYLMDNGYKFVQEGDIWHAIR